MDVNAQRSHSARCAPASGRGGRPPRFAFGQRGNRRPQVGVHYTHIGRYERGLSRPAADTLKRMADVLGVSGDYLLEGTVQEATRAHFEDRELLHMFQEVEKLPEADKEVIKRFLDAFLTKKRLQELAQTGTASQDAQR